jgi:hypothetical protein
MASPRRFPPPWSIEELDAAFVVKDSSGQKLGYFYFEEVPACRCRQETSALWGHLWVMA